MVSDLGALRSLMLAVLPPRNIYIYIYIYFFFTNRDYQRMLFLTVQATVFH